MAFLKNKTRNNLYEYENSVQKSSSTLSKGTGIGWGAGLFFVGLLVVPIVIGMVH
nr:hypothetical protein [Pseudopedobacter sp.]